MDSVGEVLARHEAQLRALSAAAAGKGGVGEVSLHATDVGRVFIGGAVNYRSDSENGSTYGGSTYIYGGYSGGEVSGRAQFSGLGMFTDTRVVRASLHLAVTRRRSSSGRNFAPLKLMLASSTGGHTSYSSYPSGVDVLVPATSAQNQSGRTSINAIVTVQLSSDTIKQIQNWGSLAIFLKHGPSADSYAQIRVNNASGTFKHNDFSAVDSTHLRWEYHAWSNSTALA